MVPSFQLAFLAAVPGSRYRDDRRGVRGQKVASGGLRGYNGSKLFEKPCGTRGIALRGWEPRWCVALAQTGAKKLTKVEEQAKRKEAVQKKARETDAKLLQDKRVKAFLDVTAEAEGGRYDVKYGGGTFTDTSTHPGAGKGGKITAAGRYQINMPTWKELCNTLGLSDFSPGTQDLMGVQILRESGAAGCLLNNNLDGALSGASNRWAALPQGPGQPNRYSGQPYMDYDDFKASYSEKTK